jgi:NAD-dependent SIR2 family protein deacetylase
MAKKVEQSQILSHLAHLLRQTRQVAALTGAGVSHESGIPTFRGPGGPADPALQLCFGGKSRRDVAAPGESLAIGEKLIDNT